MLLERQRVTQAEFRAYIEQPENTDKWFELIDGVIHEVIMPKIIHAIIVQFVVRILGNFVYPRDLGHVIADGGVFNLPNGDVVIPDASYVSKEHGTPVPDEYELIQGFAAKR